MKRVIDGLVYNTDTADEICYSGNDLSSRDFGCDDSKLYYTRNGRFFLAGWGGALSRWAESTDDGGRTGGSGIIPIEPDTARCIMERAGCSLDKFTACGLVVSEA